MFSLISSVQCPDCCNFTVGEKGAHGARTGDGQTAPGQRSSPGGISDSGVTA